MRVLFRLFMIHVGLLMACFVAALAFVTIESWAAIRPDDVTTEQAHTALLAYTAIFGVVALVCAYLPTVIVGLAAELFSIRSVLFFAAAGGVIGLLPALGFSPSWLHIDPAADGFMASPLKSFPAIGIIGGCCYWLVTGCKAGFVKKPQ